MVTQDARQSAAKWTLQGAWGRSGHGLTRLRPMLTLWVMSTDLDQTAASDETLAADIAEREVGDAAMRRAQDAFHQLYGRHARKLLAFLASRTHRSDLEDVHQAVWQRVWQRLPEAFQGGNFRAWLFQITRNYLIDLSRKRRPELFDEERELSDSRLVDPVGQLVEQERMTALGHCLDNLSREMAKLVRSRLAGDSYHAIYEQLEIPPARAHKLFHQAKAQLRDCVERKLS